MTAVVSAFDRVSDVAPRDGSTVLDLALWRVRMLARRRLEWLEHLRGDRAASAGAIAAADLRLALDDLDAPEQEQRWLAAQPSLRELGRELEALGRRIDEDDTSALAALVRTFELSEPERDLLHVCLATALDPSLGKLWATLHHHPDQNYPTESLAARLCGYGRAPILPQSGNLLRWELVRLGEASPGDPASVSLDPHILEFLTGQLNADPLLVDRMSLCSAQPPPDCWPVARLVTRLQRILEEGYAARVVLKGPHHSGRRTLAACVAEALGALCLVIDTAGIEDSDWPRVHLRAQRQALLFGSSLAWHGERVEGRPASGPGLARLQFVIGDVDLQPPALPSVIDEHVEMPRLSLAERAALWRRLLPVSQAWPRAEFEQVVERYQVQPGDIAEVARRGLSEVSDVRLECRKLTRSRLGELGKLLDCPFSRDDLMVPPKLDRLLDELLFEARERVRFWERPEARRLFPRGTGLIALLSGTPGTGKTMAAQIIAAELGLDLFRIDLASSVSKYIGETAKNLRRVFARAREMNAVLLFDEADALFSKRTEVKDAHDRYANADTNYLLQLLEDYDGIALLASNKRQNIDAAFVRRIRYVLDFPRPGVPERVLIWRRLVHTLAGQERAAALEPVLAALSEAVEVSGAQIKLTVLAALFVAQQEGEPVQAQHLLRGLTRELSKESRGLSPQQRERIEGAAR